MCITEQCLNDLVSISLAHTCPSLSLLRLLLARSTASRYGANCQALQCLALSTSRPRRPRCDGVSVSTDVNIQAKHFFYMFGRKIQRTAAAAISASGKAPFNPYKARKPWPPDFDKLDLKYQFRLERRYRRRAKLRYNRPGWIKGVKLAQWGICLCEYFYPRPIVRRSLIHILAVFVYGVLFMDVGENENPFTGVRHCRYSR